MQAANSSPTTNEVVGARDSYLPPSTAADAAAVLESRTSVDSAAYAAAAAAATARKETAATLVENLAKLAAGTSAQLLSSAHQAAAAAQQHAVVGAPAVSGSSQSSSNQSGSSSHSSSPHCGPTTTTTVTQAVAAVNGSLSAQSPQETLFHTIGIGIVPNFTRNIHHKKTPPTPLLPQDNADHGVSSVGDDATEAACKALQDALERGMLSFPWSAAMGRTDPPQLYIRLGVPTKLANPQELMHVDQYRLMNQVAPLTQRQGVELQHIDVVVGGLWAAQHHAPPSQIASSPDTEQQGALTVVACLSVVQPHPQPSSWNGRLPPQQAVYPQAESLSTAASHSRAAAPVPQVTATSSSPSSPWSGSQASPPGLVVPSRSLNQLPPTPATVTPSTHATSSAATAALERLAASALHQHQQQHQQATHALSIEQALQASKVLQQQQQQQQSSLFPQEAPAVTSSSPLQSRDPVTAATAAVIQAAALESVSPASRDVQPQQQHRLSRGSSMDVLAHVSAEIRDQQQTMSVDQNDEDNKNLAATSQPQTSETRAPQPMAVDSPAHGQEDTASAPPPSQGEDRSTPASTYGDKYGNNTNYKKLPPGKTPKNNNRLFVKHSYQDYSDETPTDDEKNAMANLNNNTSEKTPNAAFPLKLHETLSEIERDGHDDIIGWLAHGRSFKIHKQQEFVQLILPKYFVMTKKSSFLRQLNLYGFNRLSGVGPDQASYYHEKFLRGMKFLCRRMQRCKVNGNRIRAAGNPDGEPVLSNYPACPAVVPIRNTSATSSVVSSESLVRSSSNANNNNHGLGGDNNSASASTTPSVQHLATAAVLQYMAQQQQQQQQQASTTSATASGIDALSSLLALVPGATSSSAAPASAPSLLSSLATAASNQAAHVPASPRRVDTSTTKTKPNRSPSVSSTSTTESGNPATDVDSSNNKQGNGRNSSGQMATSFPLKLQRILDKLESDRNVSVLSWLPHGRAFMVHDSDRFVNELMPLYFNQTKYSSFQRQLHMYNFQRISSGRDKGAYYHSQFQRGNPVLCQKIQRSRVHSSKGGASGSLTRSLDPDFSQLPPLPPVPSGSIADVPPRVVSFTTGSTSPSASSSTPPFVSNLTEQQALSLLALQQQQQQLQQYHRDFDSVAPATVAKSAAAPSVSSSSVAADSE